MATVLGRSLSSHQKIALQRFSVLLLQANRRFNLIGPSAESNLLARHFLDAVPLLPFFAEGARVADIGSGGGLPGVVLAILSPPPRMVCLVESAYKKALFLQQVVVDLGIQERVRVCAMRAEQLGLEEKNAYDFVVSRALGSLVYGAGLAKKLLRPGGAYLAMKGRHHDVDIEALRRRPIRHAFQEPEVHPAIGKGGGVIVRLTLKAGHLEAASPAPENGRHCLTVEQNGRFHCVGST